MNKTEPLNPNASAWSLNPEPKTMSRELPPHPMDPDLHRLCALPGDYDLSAAEVAEVIQVDPVTVRRLVRRGRMEAKLHQGRGDGKETRMRFSRLSVVLYLVRVSSGDRTAILGSISVQCPQYLKLAQALCTSLGGRCMVDLDGDDEDAFAPAADGTPRRRTKVKAKRAAPRKTRAVKVVKKTPSPRLRTQRRKDAAKTARSRKTRRTPARKKTGRGKTRRGD